MSHVRINGAWVECTEVDLGAMDSLVTKGKYPTREAAAPEVLGLNEPVQKAAKKKGAK